MFVLNIVKGHCLKLRCSPLLFCNIRELNINFALALHPIIQKKVDELLA